MVSRRLFGRRRNSWARVAIAFHVESLETIRPVRFEGKNEFIS